MSHSLEAGSNLASAPDDTTTARQPTVMGFATIGLVVAATVSLILALFVSSAVNAKPHNLAIDVAGPVGALTKIDAALAAAGENTFTTTTVADEQNAVAHLHDRTADGAIILSADGLKVLTATAGSPAIAQVLSAAAAGIAGQAPSSIITDVVQLPAGDPHGVGIASARAFR